MDGSVAAYVREYGKCIDCSEAMIFVAFRRSCSDEPLTHKPSQTDPQGRWGKMLEVTVRTT